MILILDSMNSLYQVLSPKLREHFHDTVKEGDSSICELNFTLVYISLL
jgi:predicted transcriptional regulator